jgi:hypothetical protein
MTIKIIEAQMTEDEKQAIRASFAGKKVSQMTALERKVFDEDFQYGVADRSSAKNVAVINSDQKKSTLSSILRRFGLSKN